MVRIKAAVDHGQGLIELLQTLYFSQVANTKLLLSYAIISIVQLMYYPGGQPGLYIDCKAAVLTYHSICSSLKPRQAKILAGLSRTALVSSA